MPFKDHTCSGERIATFTPGLNTPNGVPGVGASFAFTDPIPSSATPGRFVVRDLSRREALANTTPHEPAEAGTTNGAQCELAVPARGRLTVPVYLWRELPDKQREGLLAWRKQRSFPWHSPPHGIGAKGTYHLTAACLDHAPFVGHTSERMNDFCTALLAAVTPVSVGIHAWCVLPNHYHLLVTVPDLRSAVWALGKLHGRASHKWNQNDHLRGRQVWHAAADRFMRSDRHYWATVNHIHNNPVRHGYVQRWQDWPYSSVHEFLKGMSREEAERIWRDHPLEDYGKGWDDPEL